MNILALDCACKTAGVAIMQNDNLLYESYLSVTGTHSETLLTLCDAAFKATKLCPAQINAYGVTSGPGSFTGLRIGLGIIKGMAFVNNTPCVPVSSLKALAMAWPADGYIAVALDARRGEVYCGLFRRSGNEIAQITNDDAMQAEDFVNIINNCVQNEKVVCIGDGAHLIESENIILCSKMYRFGRAHGVGLLTVKCVNEGLALLPESLMPNYHRLSQAERQLAQKNAEKEKEKLAT